MYGDTSTKPWILFAEGIEYLVKRPARISIRGDMISMVEKICAGT